MTRAEAQLFFAIMGTLLVSYLAFSSAYTVGMAWWLGVGFGFAFANLLR